MAGGCPHSTPSPLMSSPIFRPPHPILNSVTPLSCISLLIFFTLLLHPSHLSALFPCPRPLPASLPCSSPLSCSCSCCSSVLLFILSSPHLLVSLVLFLIPHQTPFVPRFFRSPSTYYLSFLPSSLPSPLLICLRRLLPFTINIRIAIGNHSSRTSDGSSILAQCLPRS